MSSNVFIDNVDDYVAPSQACINPLFSGPVSKETTPANEGATAANTNNNNTATNNQTLESDNNTAAPNESIGVRRRGRRKRTALSSGAAAGEESSSAPTVPQASDTNNDDPKSIVQASLADCLACSGCVTTTETVLIEEQHSISVLRDLLLKPTETSSQHVFVLTMSPAAWADLLRHAGLPTPANEQDLWTYKRQFTTIVQRLLNISCVLDGNLPLVWSLEESAKEFCGAFRQKQQLLKESGPREPSLQQQYQQKLWPSRALSKGTLQFKSDSDELLTVDVDPATAAPPKAPLLSASCPAVVCLVEKTAHAAVPHLATTASPMSLAGAWLKQQQHQSLQQPIYHIAVMPCHDKKLEASRTDFQSTTKEKDVDMVITTAECLKLLEESNKTDLSLTALFQQATLASVGDQFDVKPTQQATGILLACDNRLSSVGEGGSSDDPFVSASGGYADYIFQKACLELFGVQVDRVPWEPGTWNSEKSTSTIKRSARMATAFSKRKDFYQAILYKCIVTRHDGSSQDIFTVEKEDKFGSDDGSIASSKREPALRFAIAYGMQTLQRILKPFDNQKGSDSTPPLQFDYVEAMACPSGCINGGGQLRVSSKELPTQTKMRLSNTRKFFASPSMSVDIPSPHLAAKDLRTTYHVVPPMQLSQGAAAGMAVQDIQW